MSFAGFLGYLLLAGGPLTVVFLVCIARKSFLVLLGLASAFYWLVTLFVISSLFRGFAPLKVSVGPYAGLVAVAVVLQTAAQVGVWRFHTFSLRVLGHIARQQPHLGGSLSITDHFSLSLTQGLAHATVHSLFFCISWLPLVLGDGTIYSAACPQMNYFMVAALSTLGLAGVLTGGTVIAFDAMAQKALMRAAVPSALHLGAAMVTLINFTQAGCLVSVPLILVTGAGVSGMAGWVWWNRTGQRAIDYRPSSMSDPDRIVPNRNSNDEHAHATTELS